MNHRCLWLLLLLPWTVGALPAWGKTLPADPAAPACAHQLEAIGRALVAYQQNRGELPAHLSDLSPRYLPGTAFFHCPADARPPTLGSVRAAPDPKLPVSYSYEMSTERTLVQPVQLGPPPARMTWRAQKLAQRVNFGDRVPVVRCWHHSGTPAIGRGARVLNLTLSGHVYESSAQWELDAGAVAAVLACLERDAMTGWPIFRRRWDAGRLSLYLSQIRPDRLLRVRIAGTADRLAAQARRVPLQGVGDGGRVLELLYRAANDPIRANAWRSEWVKRLLDGTPPCG